MIAEKEKKRIELGLPDPGAAPLDLFNHSFSIRPILRIPVNKDETSGDNPVSITVMTYNVLAQALIQRRIFPASGSMLEYKVDSQATP